MDDLVGSLPESVQMKTTNSKKSWVGLWGQSVVLQVIKHLKRGYLWRVLTNKEFKDFGDILSGKYQKDMLIDIELWHGSKVLINEVMPEIVEFRARFNLLQIKDDVSGESQKLTQMTQGSSLMSEQDKFLYKADVKSIFEINALKEYKLKAKVYYGKDSSNFIFWDRDCTRLIGKSTIKLRDLMIECGENDPKIFFELLDDIFACTLAYRVKYQVAYNSISVSRVSDDA
ncbi:hypothetical protein Fmac_032664 [Flemingia macrophylla]|uniref:Uncharacterized protein n=1 Tax=Flemingia macrophylla TaxID=520843 RepID=A0ABD1L5Z7_9FABA